MHIGQTNVAELSIRKNFICILLFPIAIEFIRIPRSFWLTFHIFDYSFILKFRIDENYFSIEE